MKHSPDPWTYDTGTYKVYDAEGEEVATVYGYDDADTHANGHRIATLSAENARMAKVLRDILTLIEFGDELSLADMQHDICEAVRNTPEPKKESNR